MIEELEDYKRFEKREYYYGDFSEKYFKSFSYRKNVNDFGGDYYAIPCDSLEQLLKEHGELISKENNKEFDLDCFHYHDYNKIKDIVAKYFEIL